MSAPPLGHERRKVVTVIFADVVGSTALGERVDAETLRWAMQRWFGRMREVVDRHGGVVENYVGDAVMAVFGIPVAHEDDALRAARAAAEMRAEGEALRGELLRARGAPPGRWSLAHEAGAFHLVAAPGDRALGQDQRLTA